MISSHPLIIVAFYYPLSFVLPFLDAAHVDVADGEFLSDTIAHQGIIIQKFGEFE